MSSGLFATQTPAVHTIPMSNGSGVLDPAWMTNMDYTPAASSDWGATVPTTVKQALDLIAAKIHPVS